ncbi:hypothetical protein [Ornithinimicrobium kibberense]
MRRSRLTFGSTGPRCPRPARRPLSSGDRYQDVTAGPLPARPVALE